MRMIERIVLHASTVLFVAGVLDAAAQKPPKVHRVAFIATISSVSDLITSNPASRGFARGMRDRGYVEGKNLIIEWRTAEGRFERFPEIVRELVSIPVDVIVTVYNPMTRAAKEITRTVPIVMASSTAPVEEGLIQSLARPGGNVTGITSDAGPELYGKRLQLLKELNPGLSRVVILRPTATGTEDKDAAEAAARQLAIRIHYVEPVPTNYADALASIARDRPDALLVTQSPPNYANRKRIAEFAAANRLLTIYPSRDYVLVGGFIAYGVDIGDMFHSAAAYVDRILKGANPADLPVERPSKFQLVINLRTAKALGQTVPASLKLRADEVIE